MQRLGRRARALLAFTLIEILVAVGVLVIVIVAVAQIFSSASKVSAVAEANAEILQAATALEQQLRTDLANLPENGFMVVQQVEVSARAAGEAGALDASLAGQEIRADQIAFFTRGYRATTQLIGSQESNFGSPSGVDVVTSWSPESAVCRMYYGHGFTASTVPVGLHPFSYLDKDAPVVPWIGGQVETQRWIDGAAQAAARIPAIRPTNWPLVRLATLLSADGLTGRDYAGRPNFSSLSLFTDRRIALGKLAANNPTAATYYPLWTSGRVDHVKWQPDDIFSQTAYQVNQQGFPQTLPFIFDDNSAALPTLAVRQPSARLRMIQTLAPWATPATRVVPANGDSALYVAYPRVEKIALGIDRSEVMLTAPVLAANCSSFKVEWTWENGKDKGFANNGFPFGMYVQPGSVATATGVNGRAVRQPWFGLNDPSIANNDPEAPLAVRPASNSPRAVEVSNGVWDAVQGQWGFCEPPLLYPDDPTVSEEIFSAIEGPLVNGAPIWRCHPDQGNKRVYQAVFGFNTNDPNVQAYPTPRKGPYTPLPSAIRVTVRLHDTLGRIEGGREFQFVIDLPRR